MTGNPVLCQIPGILNLRDIVRSTAPDEVTVYILVITGNKILQIFNPYHGSIILIAGNIGRNCDVVIITNGGKLDHSCKLIGNRIFLLNFKGVQISFNNAGIAGYEINAVLHNGKGTDIDVVKGWNPAYFS